MDDESKVEAWLRVWWNRLVADSLVASLLESTIIWKTSGVAIHEIVAVEWQAMMVSLLL